jgi:MFS family permease
MATATATVGPGTPEERGQLTRAVIASTIGTSIEWYDFFLYSTVTGLVFAKLYFPNSDPLVGTLQAFAIYAVGFIARPIGAAIFGHFGDRIGRKATLIATLLLMGIATFLVAFVPGYATIGIWGAIWLTVLRFIQGVGVGGEWGGSVLLSMEWARTNGRRGLIASWPQFGVPAGLFLANIAVLVRMSEQAPFYIFTAYIFAYGTKTLGLPQNFLITAVLVASVGSACWIPIFGQLSDRIGRRKTYMIGAGLTTVFGFLYFAMLNTGWPVVVFLAIFLSLIPHDIQYGPQAAFIAESFTPRLRYSGASLGYQLASVIAGGPAPLIAAALFAKYHTGYAIAGYIAVCGIISLFAASAMHDYTGRSIHHEYDEAVAPSAVGAVSTPAT